MPRLQRSLPPLFGVLLSDGLAVAIGRAFAAILENFQQPDGSILIPDVLRPYTGFDRITL